MAGIVADRVVVELEAKLDRYNANVLAAERQWTRTTTSISQNAARTEAQVTRSLGNIKTALLASTGLFIGAQGLRGIQNLLDGYTRYTNQLKVAGLEGSNLSYVQDSLYRTAQRYGVELEGLGQLYGRVAQGAKELGANQNDLLRFTNGVAAAIKIQGGSASDSRGALLQLSQALGGEIVRAEEFNSINEGARPILQAVANGIDKYGGSVAKLRRDVIAGKVASKDFFAGFLKGSAELEERATRANFTIGQSFTILNNALGKYLGQTDQHLSLTARLSGAIVLLANNLDLIVPALAGIATGYAAVKLGSVIFDAAAAATGRALNIDKELARTILAGNASYVSRTGLVLSQARASAEAATAEVAAIQSTIAARTAEQEQLAATIAAERALILERENAARAAAVSLTTGGLEGRNGALATQAAANNDIAAAQDRLNAARARASAVNVELIASETALAAAEGRSAVAAEAEAAAVTASTLAKRVGAAATALFSGVLTTLGAALPLIAIAAFAAAIIYYASTVRDASFDTKKFAEEGEELKTNLAQLDGYARNAATSISAVGTQAQNAVQPMLNFASATGEAAQKLYDLARARRHELLVALATDEIHARQEREAAAARLSTRNTFYSSLASGEGQDPTPSPAMRRAAAEDQAVINAAAARERAAQEGLQRAAKMPLTGYLAGSERENGRDVAGELARVTRDLTVARERGIRSQVDLLEAQKFEITQYKKYRAQGLSPQAAQSQSNKDAEDFRGASRGAQGDRDAKAGAAAAKREAAAARAAARRQAAEERDAAGDAARYASLDRRANNEIAAARADLAGSAEQRAEIERARIEDERLSRAEELRQSEAQGQLGSGVEGQRRLFELQRLNDERAKLETEVVDLRERQRIASEARDVAAANIQNEADLLKAQQPLADTMAERRKIALRLLDLQYEQERIELQAITVANGRTATEQAIARERLRMLDRLQAADHAATERDFEGVGKQYLRSFSRDVNEQLDQVKVNGLRNLEDQLTSTISKVFELGGAFGKIANSIIADLVRIAIQRAIIEPLANFMFGGPSGGAGGGGGSGGIFSSIMSGVSAIFGGGGSTDFGMNPTTGAIAMASGGHVNAGTLYRVNETGIEGFEPSQSGKIIPLGRMNRATEGAATGAPPAVVRLLVGANDYFDVRVQSISGNVAVETVRAAAPELTNMAVAETFRRADRPEL